MKKIYLINILKIYINWGFYGWKKFDKKEINSIINYILKTYEKEDIDFVMTRHINGDLDYDDLYQNDDALDSIKEFLDEEIDIENDGTPIEQVIIQEAIDELFH